LLRGRVCDSAVDTSREEAGVVRKEGRDGHDMGGRKTDKDQKAGDGMTEGKKGVGIEGYGIK